MRDMLSKFVCDRPALGITASISGFGVSVLSFLQNAGIVIGFLGAVFGLLAGFYTWRIKKDHWDHLQNAHRKHRPPN